MELAQYASRQRFVPSIGNFEKNYVFTPKNLSIDGAVVPGLLLCSKTEFLLK